MMTPIQLFSVVFNTGFSMNRSVPIAPAAHWPANGTENPQHSADDEQDDANRLQHSYFQDESQYQQDNAESDHDALSPINWSMS
jgi:hypothetical protein